MKNDLKKQLGIFFEYLGEEPLGIDEDRSKITYNFNFNNVKHEIMAEVNGYNTKITDEMYKQLKSAAEKSNNEIFKANVRKLGMYFKYDLGDIEKIEKIFTPGPEQDKFFEKISKEYVDKMNEELRKEF